jgi:AcrR family transcriptional regulator
MTSEASPPRTRRSGDEIRARMLAAARAIFAERGYAGASTKEIAQRADVAEVLLFRHFGNKAEWRRTVSAVGE